MRGKLAAFYRAIRPDDERGAALYEYALVFPLLCALVAVIVWMGWWWWEQSTAAIAIHDGARDAAAHDGNLALGYDTTRNILGTHLGHGAVERYEGQWRLWPDGIRRSVRGEIAVSNTVVVPFIGSAELFQVQAVTHQRRWDFYGGPPDFWE